MEHHKVKVDYNKLETSDYNYFADVTLDGVPFTGTAFDYHNKPYKYSEYSFVDGKGQGKGFSVYDDDTLAEEFEMLDGVMIYEKSWYPAGILRLDSNQKHEKHYYETGIMMLNNDMISGTKEIYYPSGKIQEMKKGANETYYSESGEWVFQIQYNDKPESLDYIKSNDHLWARFNDIIITENFNEICHDYILNNKLILWIRYLFESKHSLALEMIKKWLLSDSLWAKNDAMFFVAQNKLSQFADIVKENLEICEKPKPYSTPPVLMRSDVSSAITIGERARKTLEQLS